MRACYKFELTKIGHPVLKSVHPKEWDKRGAARFKAPEVDHVKAYLDIRKSLIEQFGEDKVLGKIEGNYSVIYVE